MTSTASGPSYRRFLAATAAATLVGVAAATAFVALVDPYRIYGLVDATNFNAVKPHPDRYQEEIKLTRARSIDADVFIVGNSRAEIGLNPDYAGFAGNGHSAYNLAISGTRLLSSRRELDYLRRQGRKPAMLVVGLDFIDFLLDPSAPPPARSEADLEAHVDDFKWKFDALFSLTSLVDAGSTLKIQRQPEPETLTPRGFNPLLEYRTYAREQGYYALFQQRAVENARNYLRRPHGLVRTESGSSWDLDDLRAILTSAAVDRTEVHLVIYPYHAQILAMFEATGLWTVFEQWKRLLADTVASVQRERPDARIALWDFSGYSRYQCERIPRKEQPTLSTQWYWEGGHFKQELGDLVFARLLAPQGATTDGFGFPLNRANLAENSQRIAEERQVCVAAYPDLFVNVSEIVETARNAR